jgi:hypothetical protein
MAQEIGLRELIYEVKKELLSHSSDDPVPLFYVDGVDLELSVVVRREGQAGIKIHVVNVGGAGGQEKVQTVRVRLQPLYDRAEMRRFAEADPVLGPQLRQVAAEGAMKELFEE